MWWLIIRVYLHSQCLPAAENNKRLINLNDRFQITNNKLMTEKNWQQIAVWHLFSQWLLTEQLNQSDNTACWPRALRRSSSVFTVSFQRGNRFTHKCNVYNMHIHTDFYATPESYFILNSATFPSCFQSNLVPTPFLQNVLHKPSLESSLTSPRAGPINTSAGLFFEKQKSSHTQRRGMTATLKIDSCCWFGHKILLNHGHVRWGEQGADPCCWKLIRFVREAPVPARTGSHWRGHADEAEPSGATA